MELDEIVLGDAYELIEKIPDKSVDCIVTDPPYLYNNAKWFSNNTYGKLKPKSECGEDALINQIDEDGLRDGVSEKMLDEWCRILKKINVFVFCNKWQLYDYLDYFVKRKKCKFEILVWAKTNPVPLAHGAYVHDKELILNFWESGAPRNVEGMRLGKTIYFMPLTQKEKKDYLHPTIKPLEIVQNLVEIGARRGGLILDPFMGSGTTAVACQSKERHFIGFEKNPKWVNVAKDRLRGISQKQNTKEYIQETLL